MGNPWMSSAETTSAPGLAGKIARAFIDSKLTPLIVVSSILLGVGAVLLLPRADAAGGFLTGLGFQGLHWLWPLVIPILAAIIITAVFSMINVKEIRYLFMLASSVVCLMQEFQRKRKNKIGLR